MTVLVDFTLPASSFLFGDAAAAVEDLTVEFDPVIPAENGGTPIFRTHTSEIGEFERRAAEDPLIGDFGYVGAADGGRLYRATWSGMGGGVLAGVSTAGAAVLSARLEGGQWHFRLRFPDRDRVRTFQEFCVDEAIPTEIARVTDGGEKRAGNAGDGLTDKQREALRVAYRNGYFDRPRGTDLERLGEELGISPQAVSQRLSRAVEHLVKNAVAVEDASTAETHADSDDR